MMIGRGFNALTFYGPKKLTKLLLFLSSHLFRFWFAIGFSISSRSKFIELWLNIYYGIYALSLSLSLPCSKLLDVIQLWWGVSECNVVLYEIWREIEEKKRKSIKTCIWWFMLHISTSSWVRSHSLTMCLAWISRNRNTANEKERWSIERKVNQQNSESCT